MRIEPTLRRKQQKLCMKQKTLLIAMLAIVMAACGDKQQEVAPQAYPVVEVEQRKSALRAKCAAIEVPVRDFVRHIGLPYDITKRDDGYDVYFRISGGMYLKAYFTADNYSEDKLRELEKLVKCVDSSCRSLNGWRFKMRTEEENEDDYITGDDYSWYEAE